MPEGTTWFPLPKRYRPELEFYESVRDGDRDLTSEAVIPPRSGRGFEVRAGQTIRVVTKEGGQTADLLFWNANNHREIFRSGHTLCIEGWKIGEFTRLWSDVPWFRPLVTCVRDTVETTHADEGWCNHFILGSHCTSEVWELVGEQAGMDACHLNLLQAIEPFGLNEENILQNFENINIHQKARIDQIDGRMYFTENDSKPGDYIEFYAEVDVLVAVSVCPDGGVGSATPLGEEGGEIQVNNLGIEIYDTGIEPQPFPQWTDWRPFWDGEWTPEFREKVRAGSS